MHTVTWLTHISYSFRTQRYAIMLYRYNSIFVQFIKYLTILSVDSASNFSFKKKILICVCAVVWASTSTALGRTPGSCIIRLKTKHLLHCSAHYTQKEQHLTARRLGRQHSRTDPQLPRQLSNRTSAHWKPGIPALFVQQQGMFGPRAPVYFTIFPSVMGSLGPFRCHFSDRGMGGWH